MEQSRIGADLRAARERLGWELPAVAAWLRIRLSYLEALEESRIAELPGSAYALGYLRTYASALGLDPDEISRRFRAELAGLNRRPELTFPAPAPERGVPVGAVALLGLVMAAGAYAAWYRISGDPGHGADAVAPVPQHLAPLAERAIPAITPSPQVASVMPAPGQDAFPAAPAKPPAPPVIAAASQPAAPPAGPAESLPAPTAASPMSAAAATPPPAIKPGESRITLRATADSWLQVRDRQGPVLLNRVLRAGETWAVPPDRPQLVLTTGNAGGTELVVDGTATAPLGAAGTVRRDLPLDPDSIKAGRLAPPAALTPRASGQ